MKNKIIENPIKIKNQAKEQLLGIYHSLSGIHKPPLTILIHGFGQTKTDKKFVELSRELVKKEISVFRFDFSGCGDSQGKLEKTTVKKQVADLHSAIKTILKEVNVDKKRIAFVGHSLGGVIGLLLEKQTKFSFKTGVLWAPAFNQKKLFSIWHSPKEIKRWKKQGYLIHKDKKIGVNYLKENEKKDYSFLLSNLNLPLLIIHAIDDEVVPIKESEKIAKKYHLKLERLLNGGHKFEDYDQQKLLIKKTIDWIKKNI